MLYDKLFLEMKGSFYNSTYLRWGKFEPFPPNNPEIGFSGVDNL